MKEVKEYVKENFDWFEKHSEELKREYELEDDDVVVIVAKKIVAKFKNYNDAGHYIWENLREEEYIVQKLNDLKPEMNSLGYWGLDFNA